MAFSYDGAASIADSDDERNQVFFTITAKGRRVLSQFATEEWEAQCAHVWVLRGGTLSCDQCDAIRDLPHSSGPSNFDWKRTAR
jgi:DNA-binding PadR family transcriptional regulator